MVLVYVMMIKGRDENQKFHIISRYSKYDNLKLKPFALTFGITLGYLN
jgi:hypothetical protein